MHLHHRPIGPDDLPACARIARDLRFYPPALRADWPAFWRGLLSAEQANSVLIEDLDRPPDARLCAFSLSLFVSDNFIADARSRLPPGVAGHVHARANSGASPILSHADVRRANTHGGLNLLLAPYGYAPGLSAADSIPVIEAMFATLFTHHAGYQIKETLIERYGLEWGLDNVSAGLQTRTNHAPHFAVHPQLLPPPNEHPTLLGLTREEAYATPGSRWFPLFVFHRPRLRLRPSDQRLLAHALRGATHADIAQALAISPSAVKKHWESIYARVADCEPDLLPAPNPPDTAPAKRGTEKKDILLAYLRQHPEELRPSA